MDFLSSASCRGYSLDRIYVAIWVRFCSRHPAGYGKLHAFWPPAGSLLRALLQLVGPTFELHSTMLQFGPKLKLCPRWVWCFGCPIWYMQYSKLWPLLIKKMVLLPKSVGKSFMPSLALVRFLPGSACWVLPLQSEVFLVFFFFLQYFIQTVVFTLPLKETYKCRWNFHSPHPTSGT